VCVVAGAGAGAGRRAGYWHARQSGLSHGSHPWRAALLSLLLKWWQRSEGAEIPQLRNEWVEMGIRSADAETR
jgi:hypothetical protein